MSSESCAVAHSVLSSVGIYPELEKHSTDLREYPCKSELDAGHRQ